MLQRGRRIKNIIIITDKSCFNNVHFDFGGNRFGLNAIAILPNLGHQQWRHITLRLELTSPVVETTRSSLVR